MDALILVAVSMLAAIETLRQIIERESARNDAEIRRLRDALLDYGNHKHDFGALSEQTCTCGFSAALWGVT